MDKNIEEIISEHQLNFLKNLEIVLSGFIHDLNNPIAVIAGQSSIIKTLCEMNKLTDEKALKGSSKVLSSTDKMGVIIQSLRDFYKPNAINSNYADLKLSLDTIYKLSVPKISRKDLDVMTQLFENDQIKVESSPIELNLMLWNLHYYFLDIIENNREGTSVAIHTSINDEIALIEYTLSGIELENSEEASEIIIARYFIEKIGGKMMNDLKQKVSLTIPIAQ